MKTKKKITTAILSSGITLTTYAQVVTLPTTLEIGEGMPLCAFSNHTGDDKFTYNNATDQVTESRTSEKGAEVIAFSLLKFGVGDAGRHRFQLKDAFSNQCYVTGDVENGYRKIKKIDCNRDIYGWYVSPSIEKQLTDIKGNGTEVLSTGPEVPEFFSQRNQEDVIPLMPSGLKWGLAVAQSNDWIAYGPASTPLSLHFPNGFYGPTTLGEIPGNTAGAMNAPIICSKAINIKAFRATRGQYVKRSFLSGDKQSDPIIYMIHAGNAFSRKRLDAAVNAQNTVIRNRRIIEARQLYPENNTDSEFKKFLHYYGKSNNLFLTENFQLEKRYPNLSRGDRASTFMVEAGQEMSELVKHLTQPSIAAQIKEQIAQANPLLPLYINAARQAGVELEALTNKVNISADSCGKFCPQSTDPALKVANVTLTKEQVGDISDYLRGHVTFAQEGRLYLINIPLPAFLGGGTRNVQGRCRPIGGTIGHGTLPNRTNYGGGYLMSEEVPFVCSLNIPTNFGISVKGLSERFGNVARPRNTPDWVQKIGTMISVANEVEVHLGYSFNTTTYERTNSISQSMSHIKFISTEPFNIQLTTDGAVKWVNEKVKIPAANVLINGAMSIGYSWFTRNMRTLGSMSGAFLSATATKILERLMGDSTKAQEFSNVQQMGDDAAVNDPSLPGHQHNHDLEQGGAFPPKPSPPDDFAWLDPNVPSSSNTFMRRMDAMHTIGLVGHSGAVSSMARPLVRVNSLLGMPAPTPSPDPSPSPSPTELGEATNEPLPSGLQFNAFPANHSFLIEFSVLGFYWQADGNGQFEGYWPTAITTNVRFINRFRTAGLVGRKKLSDFGQVDDKRFFGRLEAVESFIQSNVGYVLFLTKNETYKRSLAGNLEQIAPTN